MSVLALRREESPALDIVNCCPLHVDTSTSRTSFAALLKMALIQRSSMTSFLSGRMPLLVMQSTQKTTPRAVTIGGTNFIQNGSGYKLSTRGGYRALLIARGLATIDRAYVGKFLDFSSFVALGIEERSADGR